MAGQRATKPEGPTGDFQGDIKVNNTPPNTKMLASAASLPLLDENSKKHTFKSLYEGKGRTIVVFIRHFFCGNCQEYTKTLSEELSPSTLSALPTPTSLIIIGCGAVELIPMYKNSTKTPFPIYADPTRKIYDVLGMTRSLSLGDKQPQYMRQPVYKLSLKSILQGLQSGRHALSGGDFWQVGGEFVFEPNGTINWCHRMKNTRDHAELDELRKAIHMSSQAEPVGNVSPGKPIGSRRTMSGAGLVRKLSDRRKSWRNSLGHGRSRNDEANGGVPRSTMEKLKEETGAPDCDRDAALAKLSQSNNSLPTSHGTISNGHVHLTSAHDAPTNGVANGSVLSGEEQALENRPAVEPTATGIAVETTVNGLTEKQAANGSPYNSTPFVQSFLNGSVEHKASEVDLSSEQTLDKAAGAETGKDGVETRDGAANGHIIET